MDTLCTWQPWSVSSCLPLARAVAPNRGSACWPSRATASRVARTRTRLAARCCSRPSSIWTRSASSRERSARTSPSRASTSTRGPWGSACASARRSSRSRWSAIRVSGWTSCGVASAPCSRTGAGCSPTWSRAARSPSGTRSCSSTRGPKPRPDSVSPADEDHVLVLCVWPLVEPAVERLDLEPCPVEEAKPLGRREPVEPERGLVLARADGERERARARVPDRALEDPGLALEPAIVRLLDVLPARREDVEDVGAAPNEECARRSQSDELLRLRLHVKQRAKRADDERNALAYTGLAEIADAEIEAVRDTGRVGGRTGDAEHLRRGVDPDHVHARLRDRNRDPAGPDRKLDDRATRRQRALHVEADVLGDRTAPRVVETGNTVVQGHAAIQSPCRVFTRPPLAGYPRRREGDRDRSSLYLAPARSRGGGAPLASRRSSAFRPGASRPRRARERRNDDPKDRDSARYSRRRGSEGARDGRARRARGGDDARGGRAGAGRVPRSQERAQARAPRRPRPRDREGAEHASREPRGCHRRS